MKKIRILDADYIINLIRTSVLTKRFELMDPMMDPPYLEMVTTNVVKDEVSRNIAYHQDHVACFFRGKERELKKTEKAVFEKIEVIDSEDFDLSKLLQATSFRNEGERSLVSLAFTKYPTFMREKGDRVAIVSNNSEDIMKIVNEKIFKLERFKKIIFASQTNLMHNPEFYAEIYKSNRRRIRKEEILYFIFVSNIDSRNYDTRSLSAFKTICMA